MLGMPAAGAIARSPGTKPGNSGSGNEGGMIVDRHRLDKTVAIHDDGQRRPG